MPSIQFSDDPAYLEGFLREEWLGKRLEGKPDRSGLDKLLLLIYRILTLGVRDISPEALESDHKAVKFLAGLGIPVACFLHA